MKIIVTIDNEVLNEKQLECNDKTGGNVSVLNVVQWKLDDIFGEGKTSIEVQNA